LRIVTDSGTDLTLTPQEIEDLNIRVVPLVVSIGDKTFHEGVDIEPEKFYELLVKSEIPAKTSQPPAGEFARIYEEIASSDPEILSIHMSSGLSGTLNAAVEGAKMVPQASITHIDTKTLSVAAGWQVAAAAKAVKAGWAKDKIISLTERISAAADSLYTLKELKYLIHGGRISHLKGLLASVLGIKPLIGVEKVHGTYAQRGQSRTFKRGLAGLVDLMVRQHTEGSEIQVQVCHADNIEGAEELRSLVEKRFKCTWLPIRRLSLVLGAHTGPTMVGIAFAPAAALSDMP